MLACAVTPEQKGKFDPRCKPFVMVGYVEGTDGYRLADPSTAGKLLETQHVFFLETHSSLRNRE